MGKEKEKRILVLTYWSFQDALIQTYTLPYLKIMAENPHLVIWLVCMQSEARKISAQSLVAIQESLSQFRIHLIVLNYRPLSLMGYVNTGVNLIKLFYLAIKLKINRIHTWGTPAGSLGYLIAKPLDKKLIIDSYEPHAEATVENGTWKKNGYAYRLLFWMEKLQTHYADAAIAVTEGMRDYAKIKYNKNFDRNFFVKPACVDINLFNYRLRDSKFRKSLGLTDKIVAVYAGKFGGIYLDAEFFKWLKIAEKYWGDKFRLVLLTSHSESEISRYCDEFGVSTELIYQKFVSHEQVPLYMGLADFALSFYKPVPSKRYCSPIKNGEYWAMGLPIIITKGISDDSDIIKEEGIGYVLQSLKDEEYLNSIKAIEQLVVEQNIRERIIGVAKRYRSFEIARNVYRHVYPL
jgi:hypothetical protein